MLGVEDWLTGLPPAAVYATVAIIVLAESMGVPLPGEVTLISAALLAAAGSVDVWWVASVAAVGAVAGDSVGYYLGRRGGRPLLTRIGRRFPRHFGPPHLAQAERIFERWGVWAVFFGRFVALLRILAGPLAGALRVPYRRFLLANVSGGVCWAFTTTFVIYFLGRAAEAWLKDFSWIGLGIAALGGVIGMVWFKRRARAGRSGRSGRAGRAPGAGDPTFARPAEPAPAAATPGSAPASAPGLGPGPQRDTAVADDPAS